MPYCDKCDKMFATRQSLWKHRKRKHAGEKGNIIAHKEKFLTDFINTVSKRAKDQPTTSILPIKPVNSVVSKRRALIDFKSEKKPESEPESDSQSTSLYSDSEPEEDDKPSDTDELEVAFRNHYRKMLNNIDNLVLILDELHRVNFLTKEECNSMKMHMKTILQKKTGIA